MLIFITLFLLQAQLVKQDNQQLLGGLPLICSTIDTHKPYENSSETKATAAANYFIQGLLTRHWLENTVAMPDNSKNVNYNSSRNSGNKSAFVFVNVAQYVDWINLQMEKLYLHNYS